MRSTILAALAAAILTLLVAAPAAAAPLPDALGGVLSVTAGGNHACALLQNHQVRCWGDNSYGELGDGSLDPRNRAVLVRNPAGTGPLTGVASVSAGGGHTCALLVSRQVACWGDNFSGQLGTGGTDLHVERPTIVSNESGESALGGVAQVSAGGNSTCARLTSGQVRCWGENEAHQLGNGTDADSGLPVAVSAPGGAGPLTGVTQLDVGGAHTCARLTAGQGVCWGSNAVGALGSNLEHEQLYPVPVAAVAGPAPLTDIRRVSTGESSSCAVLTNGTARCWGKNEYGQLGNGGTEARFRPVGVRTRAGGPLLAGIGTLDIGMGHACARLTDRRVMCWGDNADDQLGNGVSAGAPVPFPTPVSGLTGVAQLQAGAAHTCVRLTSSQARCWGLGNDGQLGNGRNVNRPRPVVVRRYTGTG